MTTSLISEMRETSSFMRSTAAAVLIAFTMLILQPAVAAAQTVSTGTATATATLTAEDKFSQTLQHIEAKLTHLEERLAQQLDGSLEKDDLKQLQQTLAQLDQTVRQGFQKVEQHISDHGLATVIQERHQAMVAHYQEEYQALTDELNAIDTASDDTHRRQYAQSALNRLKAQKNKRSHQPFDPNNLPVQIQNKIPLLPKETKEEIEKIVLNEVQPIQVAALELNSGMLSAPVSASGPTSTDLQETEDVQINETIKQIAKDLEYDPVKIFFWVRNNIEYVPTYGSIQGAQQTYENLKGNAFDTASLLIALLRASNIPARYVYGTIQVPVDQLTNWVGGASSPQMAQNLMVQAGIPVTALVSGGNIVAFKMEHIWVEAYVDYFPSRAAKNVTGDSWIPLDASFKQYDFEVGLEKSIAIPDAQTLISQFSSLATIDLTNQTISGLTREDYHSIADPIMQDVTNYIDSQAPEATIDQFFGSKSVRSILWPNLASSLPYKIIASTNSFSTLPDKLRHKATINIYSSQRDQVADFPSLSYSISLPKLNGRRLSVKYLPASEADQQVIDDAVNSGAQSIPAYLVKVKTMLQVDETTVAEGSVVGMGEDQIYQITLNDPQNLNTNPVTMLGVAGDVGVFSIDAVGLEIGSITGRYRSYIDLDMANNKVMEKLNSKTPEEGLFLTALSYWEQYTDFNKKLARAEDGLITRLPSVGHFMHPAAITYSFGVPWRASYGSTQINIPRVYLAAAAESNADRRVLIMASGIYGSTMEGLVLDQTNARPAGTGMSAVRALALALEQGKKVISISSDNVQTQLSKVQASEEVKADIRNAVAAGLSVLIPEISLSHRGWEGTGYIIADTEIGNAAYRIREGLNGGGIVGALTSNSKAVGSYGTNGFHSRLGSIGAASQTAEQIKNIQNAVRSIPILLRAASGPIAVGIAGGVLLAYFVTVLIAIHHATLEEAIENDTAVDTSAVDYVTDKDKAPTCGIDFLGKRLPGYPEDDKNGFWAQRVRAHHKCADDYSEKTGNEFRASYGNVKRTFDTYRQASIDNQPLNHSFEGGEVKTTASTKIIPGPYALGYFLKALFNQIAQQQYIAEQCNFDYRLIVQEPWQVTLAMASAKPVIQFCPSIGVEPPDMGGATWLKMLLLDASDVYLDVVE